MSDQTEEKYGLDNRHGKRYEEQEHERHKVEERCHGDQHSLVCSKKAVEVAPTAELEPRGGHREQHEFPLVAE